MSTGTPPTEPATPVQGIRANWRQFLLYVGLVFATGLTIGSERVVVPIIGRDLLGVETLAVVGSFVVSFGLVKAVLNLYAGKWGEVYGRKPVLIVGWVTALPLPVILIVAPNWWWITAGNVLLGVNQALTWSMALNAKVDLAGPQRRGLAVGIDEAAGYGGTAVGVWVSGLLAGAFGLRPVPFVFLGAVVAVALLASVVLVRETRRYAVLEEVGDDADANLPFWDILRRATYGDRTLLAAAQAGHVENFVDVLVWIALPLFLTARGLDVPTAGLVAAVHSGAYVLQVGTGDLADRIGRRPPVIAGMLLAGAGVFAIPLVSGFWPWVALSGLSGVGMALLYPNLMTVPGDACHPSWRATGMGVYRMWRDAGYAVGAIVVGLAMGVGGYPLAFYLTGALMVVSGALVYALMEETHPEFGTHVPPGPGAPADAGPSVAGDA